jgi:nucleoside-diphosphate-sugar epimerase
VIIAVKVLVTGGAGYLGSVLTRRLLDAGHHVRVLDQLLFGAKSLQGLESNNRFQLMMGDISRLQDVTAAMDDIDAVIDLAAIVGDPACKINDKLTVQTNYWATRTLAQVAASQKATRFLFASTCSVYGKSDSALTTEESWTNPLSLYATTKMNSEKALADMNGSLESAILRLSTLCGPSYRMRFDLVLNIMTATAHFENEVRIFGGNQYRPLLDVRDAASAFQLILETPKEELEHHIYNIGHPTHNITISELGKLVAKVAGDVNIIERPDVTDNRSYKVDFDRIYKLGFEKATTLEESSRGILELFYKGHVTDYKENKYYNSRYDYLNETMP